MTEFIEPTDDRQAISDETNHRVANSFQMIGSLVARRARNSTSAEVRTELLAVGSVVAAMESAHRHLYEGHADTIELYRYLQDLVSSVAAYAPLVSEVKVIFDNRGAHSVIIPEHTASRLGLIVSELLTNSIKYARVGATCCASVDVDGDHLLVEVSDNGPGFARLPGASSGLKIVTALVSSLKGVLCFTSDTTGPRFSIRIPLPLGAVQVNALSAKM